MIEPAYASPSHSRKQSNRLLLFEKKSPSPIRFTNTAKKRITHDRRIESENKLN